MNAITDIQSKGLTRVLAEQAQTLTFGDIPAEARTWARHCVLDYVACGVAGAPDELAQILLAELQEQGGRESATVFGHTERLPAASAALINGAAAHALDFDDVNLAMPGHPSVAILPALLALAQERGSPGEDVLTAFVAGYELQCRVGRLLAPGHYDVLGFHATATIGSFGAAAACAHLLRLDREQFVTALGIAGTKAAGLKSMFGTMCKPLHAGKASYHGLMAAKLAMRGFTSRSDVIECRQGFAATHSPDFHPERVLETPVHGWYIRGSLFKYHAACYMVHSSIEAARKLREQFDVTPDRVERIRVELEESCDRICNIQAPQTGLEAKFSLRLATAMGLAGIDTGRLTTYSASVAADPNLVRLRDKVELDFRVGIPNTFAEIELLLIDGTRVSASHDSGVAAEDTALQGRRLDEKFIGLVEPVLGSQRCHGLISQISEFEKLENLSGLMALTGGQIKLP
jgi:2-methylcitrate dehydratase PrpD